MALCGFAFLVMVLFGLTYIDVFFWRGDSFFVGVLSKSLLGFDP